MALGAVSFKKSLTHASRRWGSVVVWETVTPTCKRCHVLLPSSTERVHAITGSFKHSSYPCTEVVDSLWRETSSSQCSQSEESGIIPVSANRFFKKSQFTIISISVIHAISFQLTSLHPVIYFTCNYLANKQKCSCFFLPDNTSVNQFDDFPL